MGQISLRPPNRNITQLKNLILAGEFSVKVEIEEGDRRRARVLKRLLGDINAEEAGGILYWEPLGPILEPLGTLLGPLGNVF